METTALPLHEAAARGLHEEIQTLLKDGEDIDERDEHDRTAIFHALMGGHLKCVQNLLNSGAKVNIHDQDHNTPLHTAAAIHHPEQLEALLEKYLPSKSKSRGDNAQVSGLFEYSARLNARNHLHETPLYIAARTNNFLVLTSLIQRGANVHARALGTTPMSIAAYCGAYHTCAILHYLGEGIDTNQRDSLGRTPLMAAVMRGDFLLVKFLLAERAEVNCISLDGNTPLSYAIRLQLLELVRVLLRHGADASQGRPPPLQLAFEFGFESGNRELFRLLGEHLMREASVLSNAEASPPAYEP